MRTVAYQAKTKLTKQNLKTLRDEYWNGKMERTKLLKNGNLKSF